MAEDRDATLIAGPGLELLLQRHADSPQPHVAKGVRGAAVPDLQAALARRRALGDHHDREAAAALVAAAQVGRHLVDVK